MYQFVVLMTLHILLCIDLKAQNQQTAQAKPNTQNNKTMSKLNQTDSTVKRAAYSVNSSAETFSDVKKQFKALFPANHANQINIMITGIDYEDQNLVLLKSEMSKIKGVKALTTGYKSGAATLTMEYKRTPTQLWDALPENPKSSFKMVDAEDNSIILDYNNKMGGATQMSAQSSQTDPQQENFRPAKKSNNASYGTLLLFNNTQSHLSPADKNSIYEASGLQLSEDKTTFVYYDTTSLKPVKVEAIPTTTQTLIRDLNGDGTEEVFIQMDNSFLYGNPGSAVALFIKDQTGNYKRNFETTGIMPDILKTRNLGYPDLMVGGPGFEHPVLRWDGQQYKFYKNMKESN